MIIDVRLGKHSVASPFVAISLAMVNIEVRFLYISGSFATTQIFFSLMLGKI